MFEMETTVTCAHYLEAEFFCATDINLIISEIINVYLVLKTLLNSSNFSGDYQLLLRNAPPSTGHVIGP